MVVGNIPLTTDLVLEYVLCVKSVEQILNLVAPLSTSKCRVFRMGHRKFRFLLKLFHGKPTNKEKSTKYTFIQKTKM